MVFVQYLKDYSDRKKGLNPCFCGIWSLFATDDSSDQWGGVLILVFVEYGLCCN